MMEIKKSWETNTEEGDETALFAALFEIQLTLQEIDDLVDEWQPTPLVDDPTEFDEGTLDSVPTIQGPNGLKVKIQPNGKTVSPFNVQAINYALIPS